MLEACKLFPYIFTKKIFTLLYKRTIGLKLNKIAFLYVSFGVPRLMEVLFRGKFKMEKFSDDIQKTLVNFHLYYNY